MTAVPEPRPVVKAMGVIATARAGDVATALVFCRELIEWCHAQDEGSGEEADP